MGISLAIPLQMIADAMLGHLEFHALFLVGAVLVAAGFIFVNTDGPGDVLECVKKTRSCCCRCRRTAEPDLV